MATRFARVTVVADERALDVSLPADRPLGELLPQIRDLMSLPPRTAGPWELSTVAAGALDLGRSLDEVGVVDADRLYLTPPQDAPAPPTVDDVVDEVRSTLDHDGSEWTPQARLAGTAALAGAVVLALTVAVPFLALRPAGIAALLADLAICAAIAGWLLRGRGGAYLLLAAVPAWTLAGIEAAGLATHSAAAAGGLAGAGLGCAALALAGERWQGIAAGGAAATLFGLLAAILLAAGLGTAPTAAVLAVVGAFAVGLAPQLALGRSRLVHLLRAEETGEQVAREELAAGVRRGQVTLTAVVAVVALVAVLVAVVLVTSGTWFAVALGLALAVAFALRSRAFTRTGQVWPMLLPLPVAAVAAAVAVPRLLSASAALVTWAAFAGSLVLFLILVLAGRPRLGEVGAARLHQVFDLVELLAILSLVPLAIAVVGGFSWVR
jgi:type VII secretion integral membrane protein EccD